MLHYETKLDDDHKWAMQEGSRHFEGKSAVWDSLIRIARRLDELEICYAIVGAMAMFRHGYRRYTEDVDVLILPAGLDRLRAELSEAYLISSPSKFALRDAQNGVRIEF